jgi:histidyl-tRNA synthetase
MHDSISPADVRRRHVVRNCFVRAAEAFSFHRVETPVVEETSLFLRSLGDASDVVGKEMYTFTDRSKASLTLRPEGTAGVLRAALEQRRDSNFGTSGGGGAGAPGGGGGASPTTSQRLYYHGPMFRHERPQRGRYRQFTQLGVEFVGGPPDSPLADAEVIQLAHVFLKSLGIVDQCALRINTLGSTACRRLYEQALQSYFTGVAAINSSSSGGGSGGGGREGEAAARGLQRQQLLSESSQAKLRAGRALRVLDSKDPADRAVLANAPRIHDVLDAAAAERHEALLRLLDDAGIAYLQDWQLVRGLDYYCHTAFEFVFGDPEAPAALAAAASTRGSSSNDDSDDRSPSAKLGAAQGTVLAGGRYDALAPTLGWRGGDLPAVGWAAGLERLQLVLPEQVEVQHTPPPPVTVGFLRTAGCPTILDDAATMAAFNALCVEVRGQALHGSGSSGRGGGGGAERPPPFRVHCHYTPGKMPQLLNACEQVGSRLLLLAGVRPSMLICEDAVQTSNGLNFSACPPCGERDGSVMETVTASTVCPPRRPRVYVVLPRWMSWPKAW